MSYEVISLITAGSKLIAAAVIGIVLASLCTADMRKKMQKKYQAARENYTQAKTGDPDKKLAFDEMEAKLLSHGIKYRMGSDFTPFDYLVFRLVLSTGAGVIAMYYHVLLFPAAFFLVFSLVPVYFAEQNSNDNEYMLPDIANLNSLVALQTKNGVFISKVIYECYAVVNNRRLKQALLELAIDMETFSSTRQAAERFRAKFTSPYLDAFAKTLEQVQDSGSSIAFFDDIRSSVASINAAISIRDEAKVKRIAGFFEVLLFIGPVLIVFYILIGMLSGNTVF